jgi:DNA-binding Lrp family transcriptional regulator
VQSDSYYYEDIEKNVTEFKDITSIYDITGHYDMVIFARHKSLKGIYYFINQIKKLPHVKKVHSHVVLEVIKENYNIKCKPFANQPNEHTKDS